MRAAPGDRGAVVTPIAGCFARTNGPGAFVRLAGLSALEAHYAGIERLHAIRATLRPTVN
jgi:hypothetical protein